MIVHGTAREPEYLSTNTQLSKELQALEKSSVEYPLWINSGVLNCEHLKLKMCQFNNGFGQLFIHIN